MVRMKKAPVSTFIGQPFHQNNPSHQSISRSVFLNKLVLCLFSTQERSDITKKISTPNPIGLIECIILLYY